MKKNHILLQPHDKHQNNTDMYQLQKFDLHINTVDIWQSWYCRKYWKLISWFSEKKQDQNLLYMR